MEKWGNSMYEQLLVLMTESKSNVWFLGTGVQNNHPVFGATIWRFNRVLLTRMRNDFPETRSSALPRILFVDIYTPSGEYKVWLKASKVRPNSKTEWAWREEQETVIASFWPIAKKLMITQSVASNREQLDEATAALVPKPKSRKPTITTRRKKQGKDNLNLKSET
jgi:hypothetical protein